MKCSMSIVVVTLTATTAASTVRSQAFVPVDPKVTLRVVTRTRHSVSRGSSPVSSILVYQPFAHAWPQIHTGDKVMLPLLDTFDALTTFDPRGVGESTGRFDARYADQDLEAIVRYVQSSPTLPISNARNVYVLGISSSAVPTLAVASRLPTFVKGIFLAAPTLSARELPNDLTHAISNVWKLPKSIVEALPTPVRVALSLLRVPYKRCHDVFWCSGEFYNPWTYFGSTLYPSPFQTYWQAGWAMMATAVNPPAHEADDYLDLKVPVHLFWGAYDHSFAPAHKCAAFATRLRAPEVRTTVVENASHAAHLEAPTAFRDAVRTLVVQAQRDTQGATTERTTTTTHLPDRWVRPYRPVKLPFWSRQVPLGVGVLVSAVAIAFFVRAWVGRKMIHIGIGLLLVHSDLEDPLVRYSVYAVTVVTLSLIALARILCIAPRAWLPFLHEGGPLFDPGVTFYLLTCSLACTLRIEFSTLLPLFLADPMGAIVGRNVKSPKLYGSKSIAGTLAVWSTAYLTINESNPFDVATLATLIASVELVAGDWDNPAIGLILLARSCA